MSEYQYYEFVAIDQPLTQDEQAELRAISTRALITPTSFVNHYEWGDLKADPRRLVEGYFDAFLYLANWGTRRLMFRWPAGVFGSPATAVLERHLVGDCSTAWTTGGYVVIDLFAEDDAGEYDDDWLDGSGLLASIVPVRAEVMAGDLRLFYLAWLLAVLNGEVDEDELEPPVPPGLGRLSAALRMVVDFLRIGPDLVAVAAERSAAAGADDTSAELVRWVAQLPVESKDALLLRVARGDGPKMRAELLAGCRRIAAPFGPAKKAAGQRESCSRSPEGAVRIGSGRPGKRPRGGLRSVVLPPNALAKRTSPSSRRGRTRHGARFSSWSSDAQPPTTTRRRPCSLIWRRSAAGREPARRSRPGSRSCAGSSAARSPSSSGSTVAAWCDLTLHTHRAAPASLVTDVSAGYLTRRRGSGKPRLV